MASGRRWAPGWTASSTRWPAATACCTPGARSRAGGGSFSSIGNLPARSVALLNTANGIWSAAGSGIRWDTNKFARVTAATIRADGFYLGGQFSQAGPHPSLGLARYRGDFRPGPPPNLKHRAYIPLGKR